MFNHYCKRSEKYFSKYPYVNAAIHVIGGVGIGFLLTYPLAGSHPVRWGVAFLALSALGHLWASMRK